MDKSKNIVCLISGRGSNLEALLRTARAERWHEQGMRVGCVISNEPTARGLQVARDFGVATEVVAHSAFASREAFDAALAEAIDRHRPTLVLLAGFMRRLTPGFVHRYSQRLLNIHPSLLPSFPGLHTHRRALEGGVRVHGATVHFVTEVLDGGPILAQAAVPVQPDDSEEALASRVLAQEHSLLPRCVRWCLEGRVHLENGRVRVEGVDAQELFTFTR